MSRIVIVILIYLLYKPVDLNYMQWLVQLKDIRNNLV
jgi:hypothetical protein